MNVLFLTLSDIVSINESGIYSDLLREFVINNHQVYVISPAERRKKETTRLIDNGNIKILKVKTGNIQKAGFIEKGIATLLLEAKIKQSIKRFFSDIVFDLVLYSTPPITWLSSVEFIKKRDKAKSYLLLKDIFPQNAVDLNILSKSGITSLAYRFFRRKEEKLYKISDYIGCMSQANVDFIRKNNPWLAADIVEVCPNSIAPQTLNINEALIKETREKYRIPLDKTIFIYGGNLGKPQGIDFLIECLKANEENDKVFFVVAGSGTEFSKLASYVYTKRPTNILLFSQLPKQEYERLVCACDVGLIFLDKRFSIPNFPSRLLSYMHASMPVLEATDVNTDIGKVIETGKFGFWCESSNVQEFNKLVKKLCDKNLRRRMGANARRYLEENYTSKHSYDIIIKHFEKEDKGYLNV
ncbi:MAG: glycosyltransferase family 4 protein [Bacteroidales bacterium]|nr:glycosyltransferase family 4 protein [Bacteroidales bacterium]